VNLRTPPDAKETAFVERHHQCHVTTERPEAAYAPGYGSPSNREISPSTGIGRAEAASR